jgi:uncharacterized OsmC-like protein
MASNEIATALQRAESVFRRRPALGLHDDAQATARWDGGMRMVCEHENGTHVATDMPAELGGGGSDVTPGWLMRAGLAGCAATRIAMAAAAEGISLTRLEVVARSRSDTRGLLGMTNDAGERVHAGPQDMQLVVRIDSRDAAPDQLRALVERAHACSPVSVALQCAVPIALNIEVGAS